MKIKQLRLMHGLSQKEFARQFDLAQNTLSQYENEIRKPDIDLIKAIANTYKVPIDYLLDTDQICDDRIGDALKSERLQQGLDLSELASITKIPQKDLEDYENDIEPINLYLLKKICEAYDKTLYEFYADNEMYDEYIPEIFNGDVNTYERFKEARDEDAMRETAIPPGTHRPQFKKVPMLGYAAAGQPLEDLNQDTPYYDVDNKYDVDFCITIRGDSMINAGINDGDIVFIKSMSEVPNGKIACVEIDNEKVCLKRFYESADGIMLVSENPKYAPIQLTRFNCQNVKILGLAVLRQSEIQ